MRRKTRRSFVPKATHKPQIQPRVRKKTLAEAKAPDLVIRQVEGHEVLFQTLVRKIENLEDDMDRMKVVVQEAVELYQADRVTEAAFAAGDESSV